jgi:hypothetical protein
MFLKYFNIKNKKYYFKKSYITKSNKQDQLKDLSPYWPTSHALYIVLLSPYQPVAGFCESGYGLVISQLEGKGHDFLGLMEGYFGFSKIFFS